MTHISPQVGESDKFLLVESGIRNATQGIVNPTNRLESRIQVPLTKIRIQYLESEIHGVESRIQDRLGFPYTWGDI